MRTTSQRLMRVVVLLALLALVATACLGEQGGDSGGGTAGGGEEGGGDGSGEVMAAFEADEAPLFQAVVDAFNEQSENDMTFISATAFETEVNTRFSSGNPPDIAIFPNPGGILDLADQMKPLSEIEGLDVEAAQEAFIPGFLEAAEQDGEFYAIPYRMAVKSIVWVPEPAFTDAGYTAPEDYPGFLDLIEQIKSEQGTETPVALGAESGEATGWPFTDWVEEYVLRLHGPDVYDQWVAHEIPFTDERIREAFARFEEDILPNVVGGGQGAVSTNFGDAFTPAFDDPPGAWLMRQGNFISSPGFFPDEVVEDLESNVSVFYFPAGVEGGIEESPVLLGGDLAARADTDSAAADEFMQFLTTPEAAIPWASEGGFLTPQVGFDETVFPDDLTRDIYSIGADADVARYDASDVMPAAVANVFWSESVAWVSGAQDLDTTLTNIEASWESAEAE